MRLAPRRSRLWGGTCATIMFLALQPGCGGATPPSADAGDGPDAVDVATDSGPEDIEHKDLADFEPSKIPEDFLGAIHVTETPDPLSGVNRGARISGSFFTTPDLNYLTFVEEQGACTLWEFQSYYCEDLGCTENQCFGDDQCWHYPTFLDMGTLELKGTKVGDLTMDDNISHYYGYYDFAVKDYFDAGDPITLEASGGAVDAFDLAVVGVAPIELDDWPLKSDEEKLFHEITMPWGEDYTFTWVPRFSEDTIRLVLNSNNNCHGCPLDAKLVCESADTGSLTVPKELLAKMPSLNALYICPHSDCPTSTLSRLREDYTQTTKGWVGLVVESVTHFGVNHGP